MSDADLAGLLRVPRRRVRRLFRRGVVAARPVTSGLLGPGRYETTWSALESAVRSRQEQTLSLLLASSDGPAVRERRRAPGLQSVVIEPCLGEMPPYLRALHWGVVNDLAPEVPARGLVAGVATFCGLPFMLWLTLRGDRAGGAKELEFRVVGEDLISVFRVEDRRTPLGQHYDANGVPSEPGLLRDVDLLFANGLLFLFGALGRDGRRAPGREVILDRAGETIRLRIRVLDDRNFRLQIAPA